MKTPTLRILLVILWILLLLAGYYWGHKPFDATTVQGIGLALLDLSLVALAVCLAGALGRWLIPALELQAPERAALQTAAGLGLLALLWLLLGVLGLYHAAAAWMVLLGGLVLLRRSALDWLKDLRQVLDFWRDGGGFERALIVLMLLLVGLQVLTALAPPVKYDALSYHLELPRQYIASHKLVFTPDNPYWGHPQLGEMLFTWMMLLGRASTAALLSAAWGFLTLLGVAGTTRRLLKNNAGALRAGLVAGVALLCGSTFRWLFGWAYVDLLSALLGWAALTAAQAVVDGVQPLQMPSRRWMLWTGVFCGLAVGTKWTAALLPVGIFSALLVLQRKNSLALKTGLRAAVLVLLFIAPWLLKNLAATGSPLYPYILPTAWIDAQRLSAASAGDVAHAAGLPLWQTLLFPLTSTVFGWDSAPGFGADLGALLALLALPGLWFLRRAKHGMILLFSLALVWLAVFAGNLFFNHLQQTRLYYALLPAAGIAAGAGWMALSRLRVPLLRLERLLAALVLLALIFATVQDVHRTVEQAPLRILLGAETQQRYLERNLGMAALVMQALQELPQGSRTLMLWEARGLYAPDGATADPWIDRWRADYWRFGSPDAVLNAWQAQGFTHLLYYRSHAEAVRAGGGPLEPEGWLALDALLASLTEPLSFEGVYELYSLEGD